MTKCKKYQVLIEKYLAGDINNTEPAGLKEHLEKCARCRGQFEQVNQIDDVIKGAFSTATRSSQAADSILSKLTATQLEYAPKPLLSKQMALAASVLLGVGFLLGFGWARIGTVKKPVPQAARVPIQVSEVEGTVLVKHKGSEIWEQLQSQPNIYLGDTFHSTAKSRMSLVFLDKSTVTVNPNSTLWLQLYNGGTQFHLEHGKLAAALSSPHPQFVISTPHGRVEALGTEFTISVE